MTQPDPNDWLEGIVTKIESILKNDTCILSDSPKKVKIIDSRIVHRGKLNSDRMLERKKTRFSRLKKKFSVHFSDTFPLVV